MSELSIERIYGKKISMDPFATWIGWGSKIGGTWAIVGFETLDAEVGNLGVPSDSHVVTVTSGRWGLGLGGGMGLTVLMVFNCYNLWDLNDKSEPDWGFNLALGGKWDGVVKGLKNYKFFETIARVGKTIGKATAADMGKIRNSMSYLYTSYEIYKMGGKHKLISIDIPFAGFGAEVSAHHLTGVITIGDLITE